jgi:hypothetical protein
MRGVYKPYLNFLVPELSQDGIAKPEHYIGEKQYHIVLEDPFGGYYTDSSFVHIEALILFENMGLLLVVVAWE